MVNGINFFDPRLGEFLQNPVWYVATVAGLAGLTFYLPGFRWLAGSVALVWGGWLIWQMFGETGAAASDGNQPADDMARTLVYKAQIDHLLRSTSSRVNDACRPQLAARIDAWVAAVHTLSQRIAGLRRDELIRHDLAAVPQAIEALEAQLAGQKDVTLHAQLEHALTNRRNQLASLALLQDTLTRAEIQIENTHALLGTIYSQLLTGRSTGYVADYTRLSTDVDEEVRRLQDQLEALAGSQRDLP